MGMKIVLFLACVTVATCVDMVDHSKDPSFYKCPFRMFDAGRPALLDSGEVMYCDVPEARCPQWYFCAAGHADGRAVCCHILGV